MTAPALLDDALLSPLPAGPPPRVGRLRCREQPWRPVTPPRHGERILLLRALGLGDLLTALPAVRAVRQAHPDARLVWGGPATFAHLLGDLVDELVPLDARQSVQGLSDLDATVLDRLGEPPAVAVNLHGSGPESTAGLASLGARRLVAFAPPGHRGRADQPAWDDTEHEVDRWCRLVSGAFAVPADPTDLALDPRVLGRPVVRDRRLVLLHPGASDRKKQWVPARFAALARELTGDGLRVVVTGDAHDLPLARRVAGEAGLNADAVSAGRTDVVALARLVASARLVVSGDTGIAHLAGALGIPSVRLFGPTHPRRWGPRSEDAVVIHRPPHTGGLLGVRHEPVLAACRRLLAAHPA